MVLNDRDTAGAPGAEAPRSRVSIGAALLRRKRTILASAVIGGLFGLAMNALTTPLYRAVVRVEIRKPSAPSWQASPSYQAEALWMWTAAALITSRTLLGTVADDLAGQGLIPEGESGGGLSRRLVQWIKPRTAAADDVYGPTALASRTPVAPARPSRRTDVEWLLRAVRVEPLRDTRLVDIKVDHTRPDAARRIADRIAQQFVEFQRERLDGTDRVVPKNASTSAGAQASAKPAAVEARTSAAPVAETHVAKLRVRQLEREVSQLGDDLARVRGQLSDGRARITQLQTLARSPETDWENLPVDVASLEPLRRELRDAQARRATVQLTYRDKHPRMVEAEAAVRSAQANLQQELRRVIAVQQSEVARLAVREREIDSSLNRREWQTAAAATAAEASPRQVAPRPSEEPDAFVVQHVAPEDPAVVIVDAAAVDPDPVRPRRVLNLALFVTVGLLAGTGSALFSHGRNRTIRTPEDVEELLGLPVIGLMPKRRKPASS